MSEEATVQCKVYGFRPVFKTQEVAEADTEEQVPFQEIAFSTGDNLRMVVIGKVGSQGISQKAADLVDFAAAIYQIEKHLKGRQRTNPPARFELSMRLRDPEVWTRRAIEAAQEVLLLLGNAEWSLTFTGGLTAKAPDHQPVDDNTIDQVALFSGGMDSTCGLASIHKHSDKTRLISFYTRQKTLQRTIAKDLGFEPPVQWGMRWESEAGPGRGHTFYYRSFLFLCLAAAVAESWNVRNILQFENGILASAIPPAPAWMMTKHAHPRLHKLVSQLFSELLGGNWTIENPFALLTKRGCFDRAADEIGRAEAGEVVQRSETCWFHASNRIVKPADEQLQQKNGKEAWKKKPGTPCGICIPCIVRRTGFQDDFDQYKWDLRENAVRNDPILGAAFRSYFLLLDQIANTKGAPAEFYRLLPAVGRSLVNEEPFSLKKLHQLFLRFSDEFMKTYELEEYRS